MIVRELPYNKWRKYIHDYQLNKNKKMKVKIMQRSVYHKYAELEIEVPNDIKDEDVFDYLTDNPQMYEYEMDSAVNEAEYEYGNGISLDDAWTDWSEESEWRFDIVGKNYGGHL